MLVRSNSTPNIDTIRLTHLLDLNSEFYNCICEFLVIIEILVHKFYGDGNYDYSFFTNQWNYDISF
jgi:hypothetical protein